MSLRTHKIGMFYAGIALASFGTEFVSLLITLLATRDLHLSDAAVGYIMALAFTPSILMGIFAAPLIDRLPLSGVMRASGWLRAAIVLGMAVLSYTRSVSFLTVVAFVFVLGALRVIADIAQSTLIPSMVNGKEQLVEANSRVATCQSLAAFAAPTAVGWLFAACGAVASFMVQAMTFALAALALAAFVFPRYEAPGSARQGGFQVFARIAEGAVFIAKDAGIRWLILVAFLWNATAEAVMISLRISMSKSTVVSPSIIGLVFSIGGLAFLAGSLCAGRIAKQVSPSVAIRLTMCAPVIATGVLLSAAAVGQFPIWAVLIAVVLVNFCASVHGVCSVSLRQLVTPRDMLVRVQSASRTVVSSAIPIGSVTGGLMTGKLSSVAMFSALGALSILSLCISIGLKSGWRIGRTHVESSS